MRRCSVVICFVLFACGNEEIRPERRQRAIVVVMGATVAPDLTDFPERARRLYASLDQTPADELVVKRPDAHQLPLGPRAIGFGATVHPWMAHDKSSSWSCTFTILAYRGEAAAASIFCRNGDRLGRDGRSVGWSHPGRLDRLRDEVAQALGPRPTPPIPAELAHDVRALEDPVGPLVFGLRCGDDGQPPRGLEAMDRIVTAGRFDIVRAIAVGLSPQGRLFAANALAKDQVGGPSQADRATIEKLRQLDAEVWSCSGCQHRTSNGCSLLDAPRDAPRCTPHAEPPP